MIAARLVARSHTTYETVQVPGSKKAWVVVRVLMRAPDVRYQSIDK